MFDPTAERIEAYGTLTALLGLLLGSLGIGRVRMTVLGLCASMCALWFMNLVAH